MSSRRWSRGGYRDRSLKQLEGMGDGSGMMMNKRVMVVVDNSSRSKHSMMWALTHVANKGDVLTLLHIISPHRDSSSPPPIADSLGALCKEVFSHSCCQQGSAG